MFLHFFLQHSSSFFFLIFSPFFFWTQAVEGILLETYPAGHWISKGHWRSYPFPPLWVWVEFISIYALANNKWQYTVISGPRQIVAQNEWMNEGCVACPTCKLSPMTFQSLCQVNPPLVLVPRPTGGTDHGYGAMVNGHSLCSGNEKCLPWGFKNFSPAHPQPRSGNEKCLPWGFKTFSPAHHQPRSGNEKCLPWGF